MRVQPFPFGALPALGHGDLSARRAVRSRLAGCDLASVPGAWAEVLGSPLSVSARGARVRPASIGTPGDVGVLIAPVDAELDHAVLVEMEGALAAVAVASALRGRAPVVYDTTQVPSARIVGAAAAVTLAIARRVTSVPVRVLSAGPAHALANDLHRRAGSLCTWQGSIAIEGARYDVRLTSLPHEVVSTCSARPWSSMQTPLVVPLVIARVALPPAQLADLGLGDALVLPGVVVTEPRDAWLAVGTSEHAVRVRVEAGRIVYSGASEALPWTEREDEAAMSDSFQESLADAPVVVRVEVGSVQLPASRWAELAVGDTLTLAQRVGAPVTIRVSGVEVAQGELVQIEGELGVRITKRLDLPGESA